MSDSELKAKFKAVEKAWATAHKTQEEKLALATATYEMVDRHIRRLDSDLSRFESEIAERGGLETNTPAGLDILIDFSPYNYSRPQKSAASWG